MEAADRMKLAAVLALLSLGASCAQNHRQSARLETTGASESTGKTGQGKGKKRLESVTWDLKAHKLVWVVQTGEAGPNGEFVTRVSDRYEISPEEATMAVKSEKRGFTEQEAASLQRLLDTLSLYCVESVVWWDRGEGDPIDGNGQRVRRPEAPPATPQTPRRNQERPAPAAKTLVGMILPPR